MLNNYHIPIAFNPEKYISPGSRGLIINEKEEINCWNISFNEIKNRACFTSEKPVAMAFPAVINYAHAPIYKNRQLIFIYKGSCMKGQIINYQPRHYTLCSHFVGEFSLSDIKNTDVDKSVATRLFYYIPYTELDIFHEGDQRINGSALNRITLNIGSTTWVVRKAYVQSDGVPLPYDLKEGGEEKGIFFESDPLCSTDLERKDSLEALTSLLSFAHGRTLLWTSLWGLCNGRMVCLEISEYSPNIIPGPGIIPQRMGYETKEFIEKAYPEYIKYPQWWRDILTLYVNGSKGTNPYGDMATRFMILDEYSKKMSIRLLPREKSKQKEIIIGKEQQKGIRKAMEIALEGQCDKQSIDNIFSRVMNTIKPNKTSLTFDQRVTLCLQSGGFFKDIDQNVLLARHTLLHDCTLHERHKADPFSLFSELNLYLVSLLLASLHYRGYFYSMYKYNMNQVMPHGDNLVFKEPNQDECLARK